MPWPARRRHGGIASRFANSAGCFAGSAAELPAALQTRLGVGCDAGWHRGQVFGNDNDAGGHRGDPRGIEADAPRRALGAVSADERERVVVVRGGWLKGSCGIPRGSNGDSLSSSCVKPCCRIVLPRRPIAGGSASNGARRSGCPRARSGRRRRQRRRGSTPGGVQSRTQSGPTSPTTSAPRRRWVSIRPGTVPTATAISEGTCGSGVPTGTKMSRTGTSGCFGAAAGAAPRTACGPLSATGALLRTGARLRLSGVGRSREPWFLIFLSSLMGSRGGGPPRRVLSSRLSPGVTNLLGQVRSGQGAKDVSLVDRGHRGAVLYRTRSGCREPLWCRVPP